MGFSQLLLSCLPWAWTQSLPTVPDQPPQDHPGRVPNHLIHETSPYLLQHAYNPVEWYPWGAEALERAKREQKPIFLSIGYSACHWCHVMERESFEDPEIAAFLRERFISIKVDREERPDLDDLYMNAVQMLTGAGGWPMSVFLTHDLKPFYGGTYFPPRAAHGRPGFLDLLHALDGAWRQRRDQVLQSADQIGAALRVELPPAPGSPLPAPEEFRGLEAEWLEPFQRTFDSTWGGFGRAPKFPRADDLRWLLSAAERSALPRAREMALLTLRQMASGGMYDQIGGGFARYSVDERWLVPHFEKMLYDQGDLIPAYLEAWRQTGDPFFARIAREGCDYLLREMRDPGGAFWSSTDADSEGREGKYYAWTPEQLEEALGAERGRFAAALYGVTTAGSFEHGSSVLQRARTPEEAARAAGVELGGRSAAELAEEVRAALYQARRKRVPPGTDDKILTAWNGLVIDALAQADRLLDEPRYGAAAAAAADFLHRELRSAGGQLRRSWRAGRAQNAAILEDHAYLLRGLLSLFQSSGAEPWLDRARELAEGMVESFWDQEAGVFWDTDGRDPTVLHRRVSPWDGATPAPNGVALECLVLLHAFTQEERWRELAERGFAAQLENIAAHPQAYPATLRPLGWAVREPRIAVVIGGGGRDSLAGWRRALYAPGAPLVLAIFREQAAPDSPLGLFAQRGAHDDQATLYLCRGATCLPPSIDPTELGALLAD